MCHIALGFLVGVVSLQQLAELPAYYAVWLLPLSIYALIAFPSFRFMSALSCGFLWALLQADVRLSSHLDTRYEGVDLQAIGVVASSPVQRERSVRFLFDVKEFRHKGEILSNGPSRVRLNWYGQTPELGLGKSWSFTVRLKRPHGLMNPGGFDYEGWLYHKGIRATGYVRDAHNARQLPDARFNKPLGQIRQAIATRLSQSITSDSNLGVITALTIGERAVITRCIGTCCLIQARIIYWLSRACT